MVMFRGLKGIKGRGEGISGKDGGEFAGDQDGDGVGLRAAAPVLFYYRKWAMENWKLRLWSLLYLDSVVTKGHLIGRGPD